MSEKAKGLYIGNSDGDITLIPNFLLSGNTGVINLTYENGVKAVSIVNDGSISLGTTINPSTATYTKPKVLYSILLGDTSKTEGGLFKNGQIGIWSGKKADLIDPSWNIPNMMVPQLVKKYNNTDYSTGPYGDVKAITDNWWGVPTSKDENGSLKKKDGDGWGFNFWPTDTTAWWISCSDYYLLGTMGYFYYVYDNTGEARKIYIYVVADDNRVLKVNGTRPKLAFSWEREDILWVSIYVVDLLVGKNVFELNS